MTELQGSETQETIVPALYTPPGLVNFSTSNTPGPRLRPEDPFLATPAQDVTNADISASFVIPSSSFEIKQFSNLKDVVPEWEDEEVDEIMILSPKAKSRSSAIKVIPAVSSCELPNTSATNVSSFQFLQVLSTASVYSKVSLAKSRVSSKLYAIKAFSKAHLFYDTPKLEQAMTEQMILKLLTQMDLPFVLKLRESFQDKDALYLVTEFCSGTDMRTLVNSSGPFHPTHARFYAAELADALSSLYTSGIMHRAVTPEHILIGVDGHILLSGFSRASVFGPNSPRSTFPSSVSFRSHVQSQVDISRPRDVNEWSAPEAILGWDDDPAVDSWGFGVVLFFMLTGKHPFLSGLDTSVHRSILEAMILHAPIRLTGAEGAISNAAYDVLYNTLNRNPRLRMSIEDVKAQAYFVNVDWPRLLVKGYEAPLAVPPYRAEETLAESGELGSSDTLSGVYITGFDFSDSANQTEAAEEAKTKQASLRQQTSSIFDLSDQRADIGPLVRPQDDEAQGPEEQQSSMGASKTGLCSVDHTNVNVNEKAGVTRNDDGIQNESLVSDAHTAQSGNSAPSASTALYSCTSFGELREALQKKQTGDPMEDALAINSADTGSGLPTGSGSGSGTLRHKHGQNINSQDRPVGIMRKSGDARSRATFGRGLGLRKYASLDFDLDTIVSLDADLSHISMNVGSSTASDADVSRDADTSRGTEFSRDPDASREASFRKRTPPAAARRRVSFADGPPGSHTANNSSTSNSNSTYASTPRSTRNESQWSPPWMNVNLSRYTTPNLSANKLRKKRTTSTPVLVNTPHLMEKVDLPAGLEQIGLGIGYTYTRPPAEEKGKETPRRSVSLGANVIRYGALFANLARPRGRSGSNHGTKEPDGSPRVADRESEESDAMEAVMREMYGGTWDAELGMGACGGATVAAQGSSRWRVPGRVYSVDAEQADIDSTLRLVQPSQEEL